MPSNFDVSTVQGDTLRWSMYLTGDGGTSYNLIGCTLSMQVRKGYYPSNLISSYQVNVPQTTGSVNPPEGFIGGLSASATGGTIYIAIGATYTGMLSPDVASKYDIQIVHPNTNTVTTILRGAINVSPEVTKL